jgi:hypothetical protein
MIAGTKLQCLNIVPVIADQARPMQPEIAPIGYTILEGLVVIAALFMAYFSLTVLRSARQRAHEQA